MRLGGLRATLFRTSSSIATNCLRGDPINVPSWLQRASVFCSGFVTEVYPISRLPQTRTSHFFVAALLSLSGLSFSSSAATVTVTAPGGSSWTVPAGVTTVTVVAAGAGGGGGYGQAGGRGGVVTSALLVTPGQVLNLFVGGHGGGSIGNNGGGGGGGSSNVDAGTALQIVAGGGGGGAGGNGVGGNGNGGPGGNAGNGNHPTGGQGGSAGVGGARGGAGAAPGVAGGSGNGGPGGLGGAASSGGTGSGAGAGAPGAGGSGCWCGAGGGGYGGGGSGGQGSLDDAGGGGGGSIGPVGSVYSLASNAGGNRANGGDGSISVTFSYPAPTVTSITPSTGSPAGSAPVAIAGSGFMAGATVAIGGVVCSSPSVVSSTRITCTTGAHVAGSVNVVVTNTDTQIGTLAAGYTYNLLPQAVLTVSASATAIRVNDTNTLGTTGGSGTGIVSYALASGPCLVVGNTVSAIGVGTCAVTAAKAADSNFLSTTASVNLTVDVSKFLKPPPMSPGVASSSVSTLSLNGSQGPSMISCLLDAVRTVLGADATYIGQAPDASAQFGRAGQLVSLYALDISDGAGQSAGVSPGATNPLNIVTSCGTFRISPAMANLAGFGALLNSLGLSVQIDQQGIMTVAFGGVFYVARPDYLITLGTPGAPNLVVGNDGRLRFTDADGNVQILYPAFLDSDVLGNQLAQLVGGSVVIQTDGTALVSLVGGAKFLLTPDQTLGSIPVEHLADMWWPDGPNRYRFRTPSIANTSQGFTVKVLP